MARKWESIICFEDRDDHLTTSRWRLSGVATIESGENTDSGVLWLVTSKTGDDVTANLYKDDGEAAANLVATGTADVADCDNTGVNAVEVTLTESESSGLTGSFWIHDYQDDATSPVQVALCTDEDMHGLWDDIENLPGYDSTNGCAEFIRVAGDDVIGKVCVIFREYLGGIASGEAWFITDADRYYPDLRMIANPAQLRLACANRALAIAIGRSHQMAEDTMYSQLRDFHEAQYKDAMASLVLVFKAGSGDDVTEDKTVGSTRLERA